MNIVKNIIDRRKKVDEIVKSSGELESFDKATAGDYEILGVNQNDSKELIRAAYNALVLKIHFSRFTNLSSDDAIKTDAAFKIISDSHKKIFSRALGDVSSSSSLRSSSLRSSLRSSFSTENDRGVSDDCKNIEYKISELSSEIERLKLLCISMGD